VRWTLQLLADPLVALTRLESLSYEAVRLVLKNDLKPWQLNVSLGRFVEELLPELVNRILFRIHGAVGSWSRVLEDTILAHQLHHTGDIMAVEGLIELEDVPDRRFKLRQVCLTYIV
jgi:hypothetical protein